jgi:hypothetical protein
MMKKKGRKDVKRLAVHGLGPQSDPKSSRFSTGPFHVLESPDFRFRSAKLTDWLAKNTALSFMLGQYSGAPPDQIGIADEKEIREILLLRQCDCFPSLNVANVGRSFRLIRSFPVVPEFRSFSVVPEFRSFSAFRSF